MLLKVALVVLLAGCVLAKPNGGEQGDGGKGKGGGKGGKGKPPPCYVAEIDANGEVITELKNEKCGKDRSEACAGDVKIEDGKKKIFCGTRPQTEQSRLLADLVEFLKRGKGDDKGKGKGKPPPCYVAEIDGNGDVTAVLKNEKCGEDRTEDCAGDIKEENGKRLRFCGTRPQTEQSRVLADLVELLERGKGDDKGKGKGKPPPCYVAEIDANGDVTSVLKNEKCGEDRTEDCAGDIKEENGKRLRFCGTRPQTEQTRVLTDLVELLKRKKKVGEKGDGKGKGKGKDGKGKGKGCGGRGPCKIVGENEDVLRNELCGEEEDDCDGETMVVDDETWTFCPPPAKPDETGDETPDGTDPVPDPTPDEPDTTFRELVKLLKKELANTA